MRLGTLIFAGWLTAATGFSQGPFSQDAPSQDPPSRVARLNWISGDVSFQPATIDDWTAATLNYPLTTGDHLYTDRGARAELHIGPNAFRLDGQTNFGFLNLDDNTAQVRFTGGSLQIRLRRLDDQELYEVDTPQGAISLLRTGDYRIDTDPDRNATMVTVHTGQVEVTSNGVSFTVRARQTAYFTESAAPDIREANGSDDFDQFAADRDAREDRLPPPVHVPVSMAGAQDLDAYGSWNNDPGYGWVWAPRVQAGWAPYHEGRWAWVEPWGWTWIDDAPWGFAPFHYGRWASVGGVWVWAPGAVVARPVYAPALVVFVGGPRVNPGGFGAGSVAWFPLGPRERYVPAYRTSDTYIRQVNITHVTNVNVTNIQYVNRQVPGAMTAIPEGAFRGLHPVARESQAISPTFAAQGQIVGTAPSISPVRESVMASGRLNARVPQPPAALVNRPVVARSTPPQPAVSFDARQRMLDANQGRPLAPDQVQQLRRQQPAAVVNRPQIRVLSAPSEAPLARPVTPMQPPVNRMDTRPPVVPQVARPAPADRPDFRQTERPAPQIERRQIEPTPVEPRPAPQSRPAPEFRQRVDPPVAAPRPVPASEGRSISAPAAAPAPQARPERAIPRPENKTEPKREEKRDEKKVEKP